VITRRCVSRLEIGCFRFPPPPLFRFLDRSPCFFRSSGDHPPLEDILANELSGDPKHRLDVAKVFF
jgi:hypothetical protein